MTRRSPRGAWRTARLAALVAGAFAVTHPAAAQEASEAAAEDPAERELLEIPAAAYEMAAEDPAERELLQILAEETELATKTKMNSDWVPGLVTVLHGEDLEALGVETAWEALSLVPGIQLVRDTRGSPSMTVRGIDFIFNTGNVKVMINGVSMALEAAGVNTSLLFLPIEQVERIEVIRGPGSAVHGDFAFVGLVNVVTRKDRTRVALRTEGGATRSAVGEYSLGTMQGELLLSVSVAGLTTDDADAPFPVEAEEERRSGIVTLDGPFGSIRGQFVSRDFQPEGTPPPPTRLSERNEALAWSKRFRLGKAWWASGRASWLDKEHDTRPGSVFEGDSIDVGADFQRDGRRHDLLLGVGFWDGDIDLAGRFPPPGGPPPLVVRNTDRETVSLTLQEQFQATEDVAVTAGVRYDDFTDIDDQVSPRLAVVWRAADRHVLKAQHAQAYRAPTFFELGASGGPGRSTLDVEQVATTELAWVYRRPNTVVRATAFHSELDEGLGPGPTGPANVRSANVSGAELEWERSLRDAVRFSANASYVDPTSDSFVFGWSRWLANLAVIGRASEQVTIAGRWYHVSERHTPVGADFDGYDWADVTVSVDDVVGEGGRLRAGVKNVLDDEFVHPAPAPGGGGVNTPTFGEREWWVALSWTW